MARELLIGFIFLGWSFALFRPYEIAVNGPITQAMGTITSVPRLSSENLYNNPAFLINLDKTFLHYEVDASLRFKGITRDYKISLDSVVSAGILFVSPTAQRRPWRKYGLSVSTLYRNDSEGRFGIPGLNVKRLGYSQALPLGKNASMGYNVSLAMGLWEGNFAIFPSFQLGYGHSVHKNVVLGAQFLSPLYLKWGLLTASRTEELMPYHFSLGAKFKLSPNLNLLTELSYQGWDIVYFEDNGRKEYLDKGNHLFDWYQNVFFNIGLYLHGETKKSRAQWKQDVAVKTKIHREKIFQLEKEMTIMRRHERREKLASQINTLLKKRQTLRDKKKALRSEELKEEDKAIDQAYVEELNLLTRKLRNKKKELENLDILFGLKEATKALNQEIQEIDHKIASLYEKRTALRFKTLSAQEAAALKAIQAEEIILNRQISELVAKEKSLGREQLKNKAEIISKAERKEALTIAEKELYEKELKITSLKEKIAFEKKVIRKIKRKNRLPIRGQYYISYHPEVVYEEDGTFLKMGNISLGVSFSPLRNEHLYFSFSLTDKTLLRITRIHKDNDPAERVRFSMRYTF